jgi:hypothetical protein
MGKVQSTPYSATETDADAVEARQATRPTAARKEAPARDREEVSMVIFATAGGDEKAAEQDAGGRERRQGADRRESRRKEKEGMVQPFLCLPLFDLFASICSEDLWARWARPLES